jgi:hypothetical protein
MPDAVTSLTVGVRWRPRSYGLGVEVRAFELVGLGLAENDSGGRVGHARGWRSG